MTDLIAFLFGVVGGAFIGALAAILAWIVFNLIREGLGNPKQMLIPSIMLLSIFGVALAYLVGIVLNSGPLLLIALPTFLYLARELMKPDPPLESKPHQ